MALYLTIFAILLASEAVYIRWARRYDVADHPSARSSHVYTTVRGGGVIFLFGLAIFAALHWSWHPVSLAAIAMVGLAGFAEDLRGVNMWIRLLVQAVASTAIVADCGFFGIGVAAGIIAAILGVAFINAYNFMDGIDGITALYTLSVLTAMTLANDMYHIIDQQFIYISLAMVTAFGFYNVRRRAVCFAGDVGAYTLGAVILLLIARLVMATGRWEWLVMVNVYGVDSGLTLARRLVKGQNIFRPHRLHAYQLLSNELRWPHVIVACVYALVQAVISGIALYWPECLEQTFIVSTLALAGVYFGVVSIAGRKTLGNSENY